VTYSLLPLAHAAHAASLRPGHRHYSVDIATNNTGKQTDKDVTIKFFQTRVDHNGAPSGK
jgi:hypothetical protein